MKKQTEDEAKEGGTDEVSEQEKAQVKHWQKMLDQERENAPVKKHYEDVDEHRRYVRGLRKGKEDGELVRTNLIYSTIAGSLPHVYAKNPEISVTPSPAVNPQQYTMVKKFAQTMEVVLNRFFADGKFKRRAKSTVRSTQTTGIGWIKATYQRDIEKDPIIQGRIQDVQDNLQRLKYLIAKCECDDQALTDHERNQAELQQQLDALEKQVEVTRAQGMVYDRLLSEDVVIFGVRDFDSYVDATAITHRIWYTKEAYEQTFGVEPDTKAKKYGRTHGQQHKKNGKEEGEYAVWEIWHRISNTVFTLCEGADGWARPPSQPTKQGEQWYPFFPLGFNLVDGQFYPMSDVELLKRLQDEYEDTREEFADVRAKNKPHYLADADTTEKDVKKKIFAEVGEVIIVDGNGRPLREKFTLAETMRIDPANYDVSPIRSDMEYVAGMSDAAHGSVAKTKTATEAEILQGALASRTGERQDAGEDWTRDIAIYSAEVALQELTFEQVQRIAGAGAVWPEMAKADIFDFVQIEIRAGSTGKPNKAREREQWVQFLPQMNELIMRIQELREKSNNDLAEALITLARETLRRFDERIDIEEFLPKRKEDGGQPQQNPEQQLAMQEQMQQMEKQLELMDAQIEKMKSETLKNKVEAGVGLGKAIHDMKISNEATRLQ